MESRLGDYRWRCRTASEDGLEPVVSDRRLTGMRGGDDPMGGFDSDWWLGGSELWSGRRG